MKVFLSHKMSDISEEEVLKIRQKAIEVLTKKYGEIEIIENYYHANVPENAGRLWHLGTSIIQLGEADGIYFCDDSTAKGCIIEMMIATLYHLRILNYEMSKQIDDPAKINEIINNGGLTGHPYIR